MHIGILGGSGRTGREVIDVARHRGHTITTLVRHPENVRDLSDNEIFPGDATDRDDLASFFSTTQIIIDTTSVGFFHQKPTDLYHRVATAIIDAATDHPLKHLIIMSSAGTHHGRRLPRPARRGYEWFLGDVADDKEHAEHLYTTSSLPRTIVKAPLLTDAAAQSYTLLPFAEYTPSLLHTISRKTIANVIIDLAEQRHHLGEKIVPLGG